MSLNRVRPEAASPLPDAGNRVFSHLDVLSCIFYRVLVDRPTDCPNLGMVSKACYQVACQRSLWKAIFASPDCRLADEPYYMREPFSLSRVLPVMTRKSLREISDVSEPDLLACLITSLGTWYRAQLPELVDSLVHLLANNPKYRDALPPSLQDSPLWYVSYVGGRDVFLCQSAVLYLLDLRDPKNIVCTVLGREHTQPIASVKHFQDGWTLTSDKSGATFLWDLENLQDPRVGHLQGHQESVCFAHKLQDGRLITSDRSHKTFLWDFESPDVPYVGSLSGHKEGISSVCDLRDGRVLTISYSNTILAWDLCVENPEDFYLGRLDGFEQCRGYVKKALSLEDRMWVIDSEGKSLLWNLKNLENPSMETPIMVGDEESVIQFTSDSGFWMVHRRGDSGVYSFWNEGDFEAPSAQIVIPVEFDNLSFSPGNGWVAFYSRIDRSFRFWHPTSQCPSQERFKWNPFPTTPEYRFSFTTTVDQTFVFEYEDFGFLTQSDGGTISLWNPCDLENPLVGTFSEMPSINKITLLQGGRSLICCADESLYLLNLSTPDNPTLSKALDRSCKRATSLPGGRFVVWRTDQTIWIGDARQPEEPLLDFSADESTAVRSVRALPNGLVVVQSNEEAHLWNLDNPSTPVLFQTVRPADTHALFPGLTPTIRNFHVLKGGQMVFSLSDGAHVQWV